MLASCRISPACFLDEERQTGVPPSIQALLLAGLRHENLPTFDVRWSEPLA
jgi:hypothetical protein